MTAGGKEKGFNVHAVFRSISKKLRNDFDASAEILHSGGKGSSREATLREFLETYLPARYRIGRGEILHWTNKRSRQCDVVIYDDVRCPRLLADDEHAIFPLESVYGTIEVKSVLTSGELDDAFQKILSVKQLVPAGTFTLAANGFAQGLARPFPYGAVFAYDADRSLEAIHAQLTKLERDLPVRTLAPDAIVVLGRGIVSRRGGARGDFNIHDKKWLASAPVERATGEQTLLRFYLEMLRELNSLTLEPLNLTRYLRMPELIDGHRVTGHNRMMQVAPGKGPEGPMKKLGPSGIRKIYDACQQQGPVTMEAFLRQIIPGNVDIHVPEEYLAGSVYVFNPTGRKVFDPTNKDAPPAGFLNVRIDDHAYMVDLSTLAPEDFLDDEDATFDDHFNA